MAKRASSTTSRTQVRELALQRATEFIDKCRSNRISQTELAGRLGIPKQYLTDYKQGRRAISESVARRCEDECGIHWKWLTGRSDEKEAISQVAGAEKKSNGVWLPVFGYPIAGEPRMHPKWAGMTAEVVGPAAAKVKQALLPYLLTFGADDHKGIIRNGDLLLMSQAVVVTRSNSEDVVQLIQQGRGMFLARRTGRGWRRLTQAFSSRLISFEECTVQGHALAIVYRSLV